MGSVPTHAGVLGLTFMSLLCPMLTGLLCGHGHTPHHVVSNPLQQLMPSLAKLLLMIVAANCCTSKVCSTQQQHGQRLSVTVVQYAWCAVDSGLKKKASQQTISRKSKASAAGNNGIEKKRVHKKQTHGK